MPKPDEGASGDDTTAAVDTTVNDTDTSTEAEDVDLEDIEVEEADITSTTDDDESSEESETEEEQTDDESESEDAVEGEEASGESENDDQPELTEEEQQKKANNERAQARIAQREAREARVKKEQADYIDEARTNNDPLEIAVRELQVNGYNQTVETNSSKLTNSYDRALVDFPILTSKDPAIQKEIDQTIDAFQAQHVKIDAYGNPVEVHGDLYKTLQEKVESIEKLTGIRAKRQADSKVKEKTKTFTKPTRAPREPKKDPDIEAFDEEAGL